jgi:hypothetical protein
MLLFDELLELLQASDSEGEDDEIDDNVVG